MLDYYILIKYSKIGNQESIDHHLCQIAGTTCIYLDLEKIDCGIQLQQLGKVSSKRTRLLGQKQILISLLPFFCSPILSWIFKKLPIHYMQVMYEVLEIKNKLKKVWLWQCSQVNHNNQVKPNKWATHYFVTNAMAKIMQNGL